jgi:hypothetical protein
MPVTVYTRIRPTAAVNDPIPTERRDLQETADTYEAARDALLARVPEGWVALGLGRW